MVSFRDVRGILGYFCVTDGHFAQTSITPGGWISSLCNIRISLPEINLNRFSFSNNIDGHSIIALVVHAINGAENGHGYSSVKENLELLLIWVWQGNFGNQVTFRILFPTKSGHVNLNRLQYSLDWEIHVQRNKISVAEGVFPGVADRTLMYGLLGVSLMYSNKHEHWPTVWAHGIQYMKSPL